MKKKLLIRCLLGAPIGVCVSIIITIIISLCTGNGLYYPAPHELIYWCENEITAVIIQFFCSLAVGAIGGGSSIIWDIENWSLTKQTLIHFVVLVIPYIPISYILNWMPHNLLGALCFCIAFIITYIIMWISIYFSIKSKIKKMNKQLLQIQKENLKK